MKKIEAVFSPEKFDNVKKKLFASGVSALTVADVKGYGFQKRKMDVLKGQDVVVELSTRKKIEMVVNDEEAEKVISAIISVTRTGRIGDGKIFITDIKDAVRIRTGERGKEAL